MDGWNLLLMKLFTHSEIGWENCNGTFHTLLDIEYIVEQNLDLNIIADTHTFLCEAVL